MVWGPKKNSMKILRFLAIFGPFLLAVTQDFALAGPQKRPITSLFWPILGQFHPRMVRNGSGIKKGIHENFAFFDHFLTLFVGRYMGFCLGRAPKLAHSFAILDDFGRISAQNGPQWSGDQKKIP